MAEVGADRVGAGALAEGGSSYACVTTDAVPALNHASNATSERNTSINQRTRRTGSLLVGAGGRWYRDRVSWERRESRLPLAKSNRDSRRSHEKPLLPATRLVLAAAAARARVVAAGRGRAPHRLARGEVLDAVRVQVGEHAGQRGDGVEAFAVAQRFRRVSGLDRELAAGHFLQQHEDLLDPVVGVHPRVPCVARVV